MIEPRVSNLINYRQINPPEGNVVGLDLCGLGGLEICYFKVVSWDANYEFAGIRLAIFSQDFSKTC